MIRATLALGMTVAATALALVGEHDASACGGCFHPPTQNVSDITDERMLLAVSTTQTTLYDQIRYSGSPSSFAWVLPIHGTVQVGLSADVLFDSIDTLTETQIIPPEQNCPGPPACGYGGSSAATFTTSNAGAAIPPPVTVLKQQNVGPYATVQLQSTDASALNNWLAQNGFVIPAEVTPVIDEYVTEGFNFLAMKLLPDQGVQAMRPVRVTSPGASLSLPLRMAAVGTGASVGITIWVISDGRYEPQNFPTFRIDDAQLVWDFATSSSNYTTLRVQYEAALGNKAWEIESSLALNEQLITNVINSGGQTYGTYSGGLGPTYVSDPSQDYLPVGDPDAGPDAGSSETAEQVRDDDVAALFAGMMGPTVRVTRMRSDIIHAAMTADLVMQAATDQSQLSNVRNVTRSVNLNCPVYNPCSVGASTPGGSSGASTARGEGSAPSSGGWGCAAAPQSSAGGPLALAGILGLAVLGASRRRKSQQGKRS
jgi:MYXO-CTERM domain-containing protein